MEITKEQYSRIAKFMPKVRGTFSIDNITAINGMLYLAENGCKWRSLPEKYGKWHSIYMKLSRWAKSGVLENIFCTLGDDWGIREVALDSTSIKVHPHGTGALKKTGSSRSGNQEAALLQKYMSLLQAKEQPAR
jgi:transposase